MSAAVEPDRPLPVCKCGHALDDHAAQGGKCLARAGGAVCECVRYRQATTAGARFTTPAELPPGYKKEDWHIWGPDGRTPLVIVKPDGFVWLNPTLTMTDVKTIFREMAKAMRL